MTDASPPPVRTDQEVQHLVDDVVGEPLRPQVWVLLLDPGDRPLPVVMPIDDLPAVAARVEAARFVTELDGIAREAGARSVVLAWERPAPDDLTPTEAAWARHVVEAFAGRRARLGALVLVHDRGVRRLDPGTAAGTAFARRARAG